MPMEVCEAMAQKRGRVLGARDVSAKHIQNDSPPMQDFQPKLAVGRLLYSVCLLNTSQHFKFDDSIGVKISG